MFKIGDTVIYENNGVFKVMDIGPVDFSTDASRQYYTLKGVYAGSNSLVYSPVDHKAFMRALYSKEELNRFLDQVREQQVNELQLLKNSAMDAWYKEILASHDVPVYLETLKKIAGKRAECLVRGRKLGEINSRYEQKILQLLSQEIAEVFAVDPEDAKRMLLDAVKVEAAAAV